MPSMSRQTAQVRLPVRSMVRPQMAQGAYCWLPALGLSLQIASGVTGSLGSVTVGQGLYGSLSSLVTSALASGSGSVIGEITGLNNTITSMNQQIAVLQQRAQQEMALLTQQFAQAQATLQQLTTVSNFLNTYFQPTSG